MTRRQISTMVAVGRNPGANRASAFDEEHSSVVVGQRLDRVALLGLEVQRFAARDEQLRARGGGE